MFSFRIANSAKFLQMPEGAQLLYMHAVIRADDDGVVEIYPIVQLLGSAPDNLKILLAKGFIKQLNADQVMIIMDWLEHNTIRADRKVNSIYLPLLKRACPELDIVEPKPRQDVEDNSRRLGGGQSTVSVSQGKLSKANSNTALDFETFWKKYPRKTGKKKAEQTWNRLNPKPDLVDLIMRALQSHKGSEQWSKDKGIFIPYPATWLNQERWNDEVIKALPIKKKPYFNGMPIVEKFGKRYCIKNGEMLEFAGKENQIEYK
jgi:hypothetical protein